MSGGALGAVMRTIPCVAGGKAVGVDPAPVASQAGSSGEVLNAYGATVVVLTMHTT